MYAQFVHCERSRTSGTLEREKQFKNMLFALVIAVVKDTSNSLMFYNL